ncbi:MAG: ethylbenzene dehydrogenase-related protein, partial [Candidatus Thermoplasmatota archaeon]
SWASGAWTLEMRRALNTTDANDITFNEGGTYAFAVGVFNNSGGGDHVRSTPHTVEFKAPPVQVTPTPVTPTPTSPPATSTPAASTPPPASSTPAAKTPGPGVGVGLLAIGLVAVALARARRT